MYFTCILSKIDPFPRVNVFWLIIKWFIVSMKTENFQFENLKKRTMTLFRSGYIVKWFVKGFKL